jgi:hypothetical protein
MVTIVLVATVLLIVGYFSGMLNPKDLELKKTEQKTVPLSTAPASESKKTEPIMDIEEDEEEFSFEPIQETSIEVFEQVSEEPAPVDEIIDLDEEREETASGRLASLRSEIESGDRKPETREERMKRLFGDR